MSENLRYNLRLIDANVYRYTLWEYSKPFHCSFEWFDSSYDVLYQNLYKSDTRVFLKGVSA